MITCGSRIRIMPDSNTFAVYYQSGNLKLYPSPTDLADENYELEAQ
jgi:hypothetical protein